MYQYFSFEVRNVIGSNIISDLCITQTIEEIKSIKKEKFGKMVKKVFEEKTLKYLFKIELKQTKVLHIVHNS